MSKIPNLFVIMNEKGVSQKQLAEYIGASTGNVSDWKSGKSAPSIDKLPLIADYLGVSIDYLLNHAEMPIAPIVITEGDLFSRLSQLSESELDELENYLDFLDYKRSHT